MNPAFQELIDAANRVMGKAEEIYKCSQCAALNGRRALAKGCPVHPRLEKASPDSVQGITDAMLSAATIALSAAHEARIPYDTAERNIRMLVDEVRRQLQWAWQHAGASPTQRPGEDEDAYLNRVVRSTVRQIEAQWQAMQLSFNDARAACWRIGEVICDPSEQIANQIVQTRKTKKAPVNVRMIDVLSKDPDAKGWTAQQWADKLGCVKSTVHDTQTWTILQAEKENLKAERTKDRHHRRRHYGDD